MPSHNSRTQHHPARCIERIHSKQRNRRSRDRTITRYKTDAKQRRADFGFGGARIATFCSVLLLKKFRQPFRYSKTPSTTRSKPLLNRQQHPRDNDREQIARARQAAEALFTSKPSLPKSAVTESAAPSPTGRKPRVLQIIAGPAKSDEDS